MGDILAKETYDELVDRKTILQPVHQRGIEGMFMLFGYQYTAEELTLMDAKKMVPSIMNEVRPALKTLTSFFTSGNPAFDVTMVEGNNPPFGEDKDYAVRTIHSKLVRECWNQSFGKIQLRRAIRWAMTAGYGCLVPLFDNLAKLGQGQLLWNMNPATMTFPDPADGSWNFGNSSTIIAKWIKESDLLPFLDPSMAREISQANNILAGTASGNRTLYNTDYTTINSDIQTRHRLLALVNTYRPITVPVYTYKTPFGNFTSYDSPHSSPKMIEGFQRGVLKLAREGHTRAWERYSQVGDQVLLGPPETLYTDRNPCVIMPYEDTAGMGEVPGLGLHGEMHYVFMAQRMLNKIWSIMIHHAQLSTQGRHMARLSSIPKFKNALERAHNGHWGVDEFLEYVGDQIPETVFPQALASEFYNLHERLSRHIEKETGAFAALQGDANNAPDTWRGSLMQQKNAQSKFTDFTEIIAATLSNVGQITIDLIPQFYSAERVVRLVDPGTPVQEGTPESVTINQKIQDNTSGIERVLNDVSVGKYDVTVKPGSFFATDRLNQLAMNLELHSAGIVDGVEVRKYLDSDDPEALEARVSEISQLRGQIAGMEQKLKQDQIIIGQLNRSILSAEKRTELEKFKADLEIIKAKLASKEAA